MKNEKFNLKPKEINDSDQKRNLQEKLKKIIFRKDSKSRKLSQNSDDSKDLKNFQNIKNQNTEIQNDFSDNKGKGRINEKKIFLKTKNIHKEKEDLFNNKGPNEIEQKKYVMLEEEKHDIIKPNESTKNRRNNSLSNDSNKSEALKILQLLKKKKSEKEILELKENEAKKEAFQNDANDVNYIPKISCYKYATSNLNKKKKKFIYENYNIKPEDKKENLFFNKNNGQIGPTKKNYFRNVINISFNKYYNSNNMELLKTNNDNFDEKVEKNIYYNNKDNHILNKNNSESKINNNIYTNKNFSNNYNQNNAFKRNMNNNLNVINISTKNMLNERNQNIMRSLDLNNDYYASNDSKNVYTPKKTYIRLGKNKERNIFHRKINRRNQIPIGTDYFKNINSIHNVYYKKNKSPKKIINHSLGEKQIELRNQNTNYDNFNSFHSNSGNYENDSKYIQNERKKINKTRILIKKKIIHNKNKSQFTTNNINKMNNIYNIYCSNNISNKIEAKSNNTQCYNNYIKKKIPNNSLDKKDKQNKIIQNKIIKMNKDKKSSIMQYIEELLIIDDKYNLIITKIESAESKSISNECFDFLNYFYNSIIYLNFEQIMNESENYETINLFIKYALLSIIICYDLSLDNDTINIHLKLSEILEMNYKSFIIILEMIYNKIDIENKDNDDFWLNNLSHLINNWKYLDETEISLLNKKNISKIESINLNIKLINSKIEYILVNYSKGLNQCLYSLFKKINDKSIEDINYFYREYILREDNLGCSILASSYLKEFKNFTPEKVPYIRDPNKKKFTLVLDLEETLVHFKIEENIEEGILKLRPGVLKFLDQVSQYYELVLFSEASQEYSDLILEAFEENKKYFDYKLYRQHTVIKNQDFIKDLTRLGRPLNTIIIVDNMPQNFRLQNMNGIAIKPFRGEDINDRALFDLSTILINIAKENSDVRNGLVHYHQEIVTKIVSNIYKHYK